MPVVQDAGAGTRCDRDKEVVRRKEGKDIQLW